MNIPLRKCRRLGFTLIELLVVISILGILMSLAVNGASAIRAQARTAQARNDCMGLSAAIRSFYTDYSRYPVASTKRDDIPLEPAQTETSNSEVIKALMGKDPVINPRSVQYYETKFGKQNSSGQWIGGLSKEGGLFDPWGYTYGICVDGDYNGDLKYSGNSLKYYATTPGDVEESLWKQIPGGVGTFSLGKDQCSESKRSFAPGILSWY